MLSWTNMQSQFQDLTADTSTDALTFGKRNMNIGLHITESEIGSYFEELTRTGTTSSSTNVVSLPENFIRLKAFYVTVGTVQYNCEPVYDEATWRYLNASTQSSKSNFARKVFVRKNSLEIYPKPSSANTWTMIYEAENKDLSNDDYTAGTITTLAALGTAVTGSSTTFAASMIGRYFKINADGAWYDITATPSATTLTLGRAYQGTAISAGTSTYTIGEMAPTPSPTHHIPVLYALWMYYQGYKKDEDQALVFRNQFQTDLQWAKATYGKRYSTGVIPSQRGLRRSMSMINPNYYPNPIT